MLSLLSTIHQVLPNIRLCLLFLRVDVDNFHSWINVQPSFINVDGWIVPAIWCSQPLLFLMVVLDRNRSWEYHELSFINVHRLYQWSDALIRRRKLWVGITLERIQLSAFIYQSSKTIPLIQRPQSPTIVVGTNHSGENSAFIYQSSKIVPLI